MEREIQRVRINQRWEMYDLHRFPHYYSQLYALLYFLNKDLNIGNTKVAESFYRYPWRGGYSTVNFYNDLYFAVDDGHRPLVQSIRYSSPGFIDILVIPVIAATIAISVTTIAMAVDKADEVYNRIYKRAKKRKLLSMSIHVQEKQLEQQLLQLILESTKELAEVMRFDRVEDLQYRTNNNLATFKILMSFYRRARALANFVVDEKAYFDEEKL